MIETKQNLMLKAQKKVNMGILRAGVLICSSTFVFGTDIFKKGNEVLTGLYNDVVGISTVVAITAIVIALLISMFSHNQKMIDTMRGTAKGVAVTWLVINGIGFVVAYVKPWISNAPSPF